MRPKNFFKSAIAGFTAIAMAATLLPYGNCMDVQAADAAIEQPVYANAAGTSETTDYLFVYFPYAKNVLRDERIYFGISEDGLNFTALNNEKFIFESELGTHGLRDPFIIRSNEGDKFYLLATDLNAAEITVDGIKYPGMGFATGYETKLGSKSIMVWESDDLVNWSEQRECPVAIDTAGCAWAPEAYWDDEEEEYVVFWSSTTSEDEVPYSKKRLYYATTKDFKTFSEAQVWIDGEADVIDTTVIKAGEYYYRYSKNESKSTVHDTPGKRVYCERSKSLTASEWEFVHADSLDVGGGQIEGPCIFKLNDDDVENARNIAALKGFDLTGDDIYCLIADQTQSTIFPGLSDDISAGNFHVLGTKNAEQIDGTTLYSMPAPIASHGTIMPITSEEYNNLRLKWDEAYKTAATPYVEQVKAATQELSLPTKASADMTLPSAAADGVAITWKSSDPSVIAADGKVNRPSYEQGDATVTLTATLTAGPDDGTIRDQIRTKSFTITVEKKAKEEIKEPSVFTITFNSDGGTSVASQSVTEGQKATAPANPAKNGYTFAGWYNGNTKYDFNSAVTGNLTLTAKWEQVEEAITVKAPSKPTLKNKKKKQLTITIKKVAGAAGYQVTYSTDKKFKKKVTKTKNITKNTLTLKNLKKGKTYYVKVKAYKKDSKGNKVYSKFSKVAKLKIKK